MGQSTWIKKAQFVALTLCLAYWTPSLAQSPGGAVPARTPIVVPSSSDLAPLQVIPLGTVDSPRVPETPLRELGKPEDDLRIDVTRYTVDNSAPPALRAKLADLTQNFVGKDRSFEDLNNARAEVTRFLQSELGYYLGYAYVPEQLFKDGVVQLAVLEGRLDKVILNWPTGKALPVRQAVVQGFLDRLIEGSILLVRDIERVVFLVNDLSGVKTRFDIQPGSKPGTANIVVTPEAESVWLGKAEADANGSRYIGALRLGGLVQMNSPLGSGDVVTANVLTSTTQGLSFGLVGYSLPVGSDGIKVGSSLSTVKYQLDRALFPLDLNGSALTFTGYGLYPVIRARNLNLFSVLSLERKTYEDRQGAADSSSRKNVETLGLGGTGDFRDAALGGGVSTFDVNLISGRVNYPAGRPGGLEDAPNFTKLSFGFSRLQDLLFVFPGLQDTRSGKVLAYASMRGQIAFANLDTTEQFRIGGSEGVRAFAPGEGTGDEGVVLSLEARLLPPESWFGRISSELVMSAFFDTGFVRYRHKTSAATVGALANSELFSGAGLALSWVRPGGYAVRASVAAPISGVPRSDPLVRSPRLYLLATKFFN